ncbi:hypothetical protein IC615_22540 [Serratia ureilytica]
MSANLFKIVNVRYWHEADRQSPHASISPPYSTPQQRWSETTPALPSV